MGKDKLRDIIIMRKVLFVSSTNNDYLRRIMVYIFGIFITTTIIISIRREINNQVFVNGFLHQAFRPVKKSISSSNVLSDAAFYRNKRNNHNLIVPISIRQQQNDCITTTRPTMLDQKQRSNINRSENKQNSILFQPNNDSVRRKLLSSMIVTSSIVLDGMIESPSPVNAFILDQQSTQRRQLELCIVTLLRVLYWVLYTIDEFKQQNEPTRIKSLYLQTRLGAKAVLTGKLGDGSTGKVYTLSKFQIPGCLSDLEWYSTNSQVKGSDSKRNIQRVVLNAKTTFYEGLANIVEFDGFDTLYDPSPRASLTLQQYTTAKCQYVQRILSETVLPAGIQLVTSFGGEPLQIAENYINLYYKNEIYQFPTTVITNPPPPPNTQLTSNTDIPTQVAVTKSIEPRKDDDDYDGSY